MALAAVVGCGGPGEVGPKAYDYANALYSIANRQASDRIDGVAEKIEAELAAGELSERESGLLTAILDDCRAGEWKQAASAARAIMEDQVVR